MTLSSAELRRRVIDPASIAGVTPVVFDDARRRGVRAFQVRNARGLQLSLILDRGLDASELLYRGIPLTWYGPGNASPVEGRDPSVDAFERTFFGGLVTTCGMDAYGPPGRDAWGTWPQHGHFNRTAAVDVRFMTDWEANEPTIEIAGTIHQFQMFGAAFRVERTWRVHIDANTIELRDRVTNDGGRREPHLLLYHCNAGYPLLDERTSWKLDAGNTRARDDAAASGLDQWMHGGTPRAEFEEQVFTHDPRADEDGWSAATVYNPTLDNGTALEVSFRPDQLPGLFTWRMLGFGSYVMAVEAANCPIVGGRLAAGNALPFLEAGERREYVLRFTVCSGSTAAQAGLPAKLMPVDLLLFNLLNERSDRPRRSTPRRESGFDARIPIRLYGLQHVGAVRANVRLPGNRKSASPEPALSPQATGRATSSRASSSPPSPWPSICTSSACDLSSSSRSFENPTCRPFSFSFGRATCTSFSSCSRRRRGHRPRRSASSSIHAYYPSRRSAPERPGTAR